MIHELWCLSLVDNAYIIQNNSNVLRGVVQNFFQDRILSNLFLYGRIKRFFYKEES